MSSSNCMALGLLHFQTEHSSTECLCTSKSLPLWGHNVFLSCRCTKMNYHGVCVGAC